MKEQSKGLASLIEALNHPDKKVIRQAADRLITLAARQPELSRKLEELLNQTSEERRWPIAYVLAHVSRPSASCLNALKQVLSSKDADIRWAVALLLVRMGNKEAPVIDLLFDLVKSGSPTQRRMAIYCIRDLDLRENRSLQALLRSLQDPDPLVRVAAVTSLKLQRDIGREGLDQLLQLFLREPDRRVKYSLALTLAKLGAQADRVRSALKDAARSDDPQLRKAAQAALALIEKKRPASTA